MLKTRKELENELEILVNLVDDLHWQMKESKCECGEHLICPACEPCEIEDAGRKLAEAKEEARD